MKNTTEKKAANKTGSESWLEEVLPTILGGFQADDMVNVDESALFYNATPTGSLVSKAEERAGQKVYKDRLTFCS